MLFFFVTISVVLFVMLPALAVLEIVYNRKEKKKERATALLSSVTRHNRLMLDHKAR